MEEEKGMGREAQGESTCDSKYDCMTLVVFVGVRCRGGEEGRVASA